MGRLTKHKQTTDGETYDTEYKYNMSGGMIEQTYPSGRVVKNVINNDGELSLVQSKKNATAGYFDYAKNFTYTPHGGVESMQLGNGKWESTTFNSRLQPTQIALGTLQNGTDKLKLNFEYNTIGQNDNNGNVLKQTITVPTVGTNNGFTAVQTYTYDELNRLKSATENIDGNTTASWKQTFTYDRYGNRNFDEDNTTTLTKLCGTAPNFTVCTNDRKAENPSISPTNNRIIEDQDNDQVADYKFDLAGNTTKDVGNKRYTYDGENRQIKVETIDANGNVTGTVGDYWYDGDGKRVKKKVGTDITIFVYNGSGQLVAEYATQISQTPKVSYLTSDHLGSPRITTDANGDIYTRRDFMPFGEEIDSSHTSQRTATLNYASDEIRQKFTSYERDKETGLDFAQARMYVNTLGRFTSVDPLMASGKSDDPQSWNRYAYVGNNPLAFVDPDGKLKRKKNGKIDFKKDGKAYWTSHAGSPNKAYRVQPGYVLADDGKTKIRVLKTVNKIGDVVRDKNGNIKFKKNGEPLIKNKKKDKNKTFKCDCHGLTFADGEYWINDSEVNNILTGDGYKKRKAGSGPQIGDVAIYRNANGKVVHSATVTSVENGNVVTVSGIGGIRNSSETTASDEQFGNITPEYHYDPDDTRTEEQKKENLERVKNYKKAN